MPDTVKYTVLLFMLSNEIASPRVGLDMMMAKNVEKHKKPLFFHEMNTTGRKNTKIGLGKKILKSIFGNVLFRVRT